MYFTFPPSVCKDFLSLIPSPTLSAFSPLNIADLIGVMMKAYSFLKLDQLVLAHQSQMLTFCVELDIGARVCNPSIQFFFRKPIWLQYPQPLSPAALPAGVTFIVPLAAVFAGRSMATGIWMDTH